jgi:hypothetical protein
VSAFPARGGERTADEWQPVLMLPLSELKFHAAATKPAI